MLPIGSFVGYLSEPVTTKNTFHGVSRDFVIGSTSMQGWRTTMEDRHSIFTGLPPDPIKGYFAVFDGHGGNIVAEYANTNMYEYVINEISLMQGNITIALQESYLKLDERMQSKPLFRKEPVGSTAVVVLVTDNTLYCANAGDSRAVACISGDSLPLSYDHKPTLPYEKNRILRAGGYIEMGRVNGELAMSRALGDFSFKRNPCKGIRDQMVTPYPDVNQVSINEEWEFLVVACDGVWDMMSSQSVCTFIRSRIIQNILPSDICERLLDEIIYKGEMPDVATIGTDNMTIIIAVFRNSAMSPYKNLTGVSINPIRYMST